MNDYGLVRRRHHLLYGYRHGALLGWPDPVKHFIVHVFNWTTCRLFGHHTFGPWPEQVVDSPDGRYRIPAHKKTCSACSKEWE